MIVKHYSDIPAMPVAMEGAEDVLIRNVVTIHEGAPNFTMRVFDVKEGGHTPLHAHDYEHEIFVLEGEGEVTEERRVHALRPGSVVLIRPGTRHQFRNTGDAVFRFICVIPVRAGPEVPPPSKGC